MSPPLWSLPNPQGVPWRHSSHCLCDDHVFISFSFFAYWQHKWLSSQSLWVFSCQWDQCYLPCPGAGPIKKSNAMTVTKGLALGCSVHLPCLPPCPVSSPHTCCPGLGVSPRCLQGEAQSPAQGDLQGPWSHKTRPPIPAVTTSVTLEVKAQPYVCLSSMWRISAKTHQDLLVWNCRGPRASVASLLSGC